MLIRLFVENFLSFNTQQEFSLVAGKTRRHKNHIVGMEKQPKLQVLRTGLLYGANASGKSNLVKVLQFVKRLVLQGTKVGALLQFQNFRLREEGVNNDDSKIQLEFMAGQKVYSYGFVFNNRSIKEEWLFEVVDSNGNDRMIFERFTDSDNNTRVESGTIAFKNEDDRKRFEFVGQGTRHNQLFLTESIDRNLRHLQEVYDWFDDSLRIITPSTKVFDIMLITVNKGSTKEFVEYLRLFNTGIDGLKREKIDFEKDAFIPNSFKEEIRERIQDTKEEVGFVFSESDSRLYTFFWNNKEGEVQALELKTEHEVKTKKGEKKVVFEMGMESDGTRRLFDLIPTLFASKDKNTVYVIDELDRSLHPELSYKFMELFLQNERFNNSQLIVSTHETSLLTLDLLRHDEIWFVKKNAEGESEIYSLEEFNIKSDKDIRNAYLQGRFGAIPKIRELRHSLDGAL